MLNPIIVNEIIVATSDDPKNDLLEKHIQSLGYPCERGSENDVLSRFYDIAEKYNIDIIVRITGDCPFIDSSIVFLGLDSVPVMTNCLPTNHV